MKKNAEPKVSIIIPAYNAKKYLKESIDSALSQTYKNIEIIVVNDGSTDSTEKIAKSYGDKIKYYYKENGGVSTALNLAISKMTGEYFSWLSHDDRYYPEKIEKQIKYLNSIENNENVILYSDYDLMDIYSRIFAVATKNHEELIDKPEYALLHGNINGITLLIPKKAFEECGLFDENLRCAQDYELWHKMEKKYKFVHQPEVLATTRLHNEQQTTTSPQVLLEGNDFWIRLIEDTDLETKIKLKKTEYNFYYDMKIFMETTQYTDVVKFLDNKINEIREKNKDKVKNIKVSVIIPFYNREKELLKAVNTVLNQTHKNIEIILINDGSSKNLKEIDKLIEQYRNIKYIKLEKNYGAAYARNKGIEEATGEYIAFLDSDDEFIEDKIEKQLFEMYLKDYNFSHTSYKRRQNNGQECIIESGILNGKAIPRIIASCGIATPTIMIKTSYLRQNNIRYNTNLTIGEDVCFYLEALRNTEILGINEALTIVNTNENSAAYNAEKQVLGIKTIIKYVLNDEEFEKYNSEIALLFNEFLRVYNPIDHSLLSDSEKYRQVLESTSWKITKPLRSIKNIINLYKEDGIVLATKSIIKKILIKLKILK